MKIGAKRRKRNRANPGRGPGRPSIYVKDKDGNAVVGLSYDRANNCHYNTHWKTERVKKRSFGKDRDVAIDQFRLWDAERKGHEEYVEIPEDQTYPVTIEHYEDMGIMPEEKLKEYSEEIQKEWRGKMHVSVTEEDGVAIPESFIWRKARELIVSKSLEEVRRLLQIPTLQFKDSERPITLKKIGEMYLERISLADRNDKYIRGANKYWAEFCRYTGARSIMDLTVDSVLKYKKDIYGLRDAKKWRSPSSINNRFSIVKSVFRNAVDESVRYPSRLSEIQKIQAYLSCYLREEEAE